MCRQDWAPLSDTFWLGHALVRAALHGGMPCGLALGLALPLSRPNPGMLLDWPACRQLVDSFATRLLPQDLLLAVLAEEQPLRLAANSGSAPPLLAGTAQHSFPQQAQQQAPAAAAAAGAAGPQALHPGAQRGIQAVPSGGIFPNSQVGACAHLLCRCCCCLLRLRAAPALQQRMLGYP